MNHLHGVYFKPKSFFSGNESDQNSKFFNQVFKICTPDLKLEGKMFAYIYRSKLEIVV